MTKTCSLCKEGKALDAFGKKGNGLRSQCKECRNIANKQWYIENRDAARASMKKWYANNREAHRRNGTKSRLNRRYGMTVEQFNEILNSQKHLCAICQNPSEGKSFCVDHDHETGAVRGLLCNYCNRGIGLLRDDPRVLRNAVTYLESHKL